MAFDRTHLAAMVHADGQTWWQYKTTDTKNTVDTAGYFNEAVNMLAKNDLIYVIASNGNGLSFVNANDGTAVDITDITGVGTADNR